MEPQDLGRQEQALMLEGKDAALCHPGCVHQPVTPLEAPSHILSTGTTHPTWCTPPISRGAESKDCTSCPGNGGALDHNKQPQKVPAMACWGWLLEEKWTQIRLRKVSGADSEGDLVATASHLSLIHI